MEALSSGLRKGAWTVQEDSLLRQCIDKYGEGKWHQVPLRAGLNRCRKSCRLRWLNYLKPSIKRGTFSSDEVDLLLRLHKLLGNRWSLIAGRIPGRTANDIKNYWNTHISKKQGMSCNTKMGERNPTSSAATSAPKIEAIKPIPQSFSKNGCSRVNGFPEVDLGGITNIDEIINSNNNNFCEDTITCNKDKEKYVNMNNGIDGERMWWESLLEESGEADAVSPAAMATDEDTSLMFEVEQLWSKFHGEIGERD